MRRGPTNGPGTIPALSGECPTPILPLSPSSAPTHTAIPERVQSLGATRKKASSNETFDLAESSGTSVNIAIGTSVHRPSPPTTGSAGTTSSSPSSTAWCPAQGFARSLEKRASLTPRYDAWRIASADIACSFMNECGRRRLPTSPSSSMAFEPLSTASTGRWTSIS